MTQSKENQTKTLHLVLKSKWFDKIASGEKTSEYRECKPYWNKRFAVCLLKNVFVRVIFHRGYTSETMEFEIIDISITRAPNDLELDECWEIKLGKRIK